MVFLSLPSQGYDSGEAVARPVDIRFTYLSIPYDHLSSNYHCEALCGVPMIFKTLCLLFPACRLVLSPVYLSSTVHRS